MITMPVMSIYVPTALWDRMRAADLPKGRNVGWPFVAKRAFELECVAQELLSKREKRRRGSTEHTVSAEVAHDASVKEGAP